MTVITNTIITAVLDFCGILAKSFAVIHIKNKSGNNSPTSRWTPVSCAQHYISIFKLICNASTTFIYARINESPDTMIEALGLIVGGPGRDRTGDTWIFSPLLLPAELPGHTRLADHTRFELVISSVTGKHVGPLHQWSRSLLALQYYRDYCSFLQAKNEKSRQDASLYIIYKDKSPLFPS